MPLCLCPALLLLLLLPLCWWWLTQHACMLLAVLWHLASANVVRRSFCEAGSAELSLKSCRMASKTLRMMLICLYSEN